MEGIHFHPSLYAKYPTLVIPILLKIQNKTLHKKRIIEKSAGRDLLQQKLLRTFNAIRKVQDFLIDEANTLNVHIFETGNSTLEESTAQIISLLE